MGVAPPPGNARLLLGNLLDAEAVVTVDKRTIKIAPKVGSKAPDGPSLELPPGKYAYSLKVAGRSPQSEVLELGADESWGLLVGPGGALPIRVY